ncbi:Glutathione S-transferase domain protein [Gloeothece citriformis PCC 7424]|uniref:Glutathione S-transferase domain protein n=1 Tax=Gloeothece citriformis (strain PCC 7424) TaxID=65393 RepID=B7KIT2_GLOC7|nr:glutathione S-transferase family protein [Gloeothece citriformis]ACK70768.1 Glutathione S-transferase domain protein [Gloeothece citriformis PCC 7424]
MVSEFAPELQFYFNPNCPYAQRSWIALLELNVNFKPIEIELGSDNKTDWFLALNPNGKVPVIQQGETIVYESLIVNEYLSEVFGGHLMPSEAGKRAWGRILMGRCDSHLVKLSYSYLSHKREEDSAKDEQLKQDLEAELRFLDQAIQKGGGTYFLGEELSLVDIAYVPFFQRISVTLPAFKHFDLKEKNLPYLNQWLEAIALRESCIKTSMNPEKIKEIYSHFLKIDYFKKVGIATQ